MRALAYPSKPQPGDRIAVLSPSAGLPAIFPDVYELGLRRLRDEFGLEPVEYPTTREIGSDPRERVRDIHAAFADPSVTAVIATIGGDDQITLMRHVDDALLRDNPKPYFGASDNTNLLNRLFNLGIVSYHGGSVMVHLGRGGALHPLTADSLRAALFTNDWYALREPATYGDEPLSWEDPANLEIEPPMVPATGWLWRGPRRVVEAPAWGGCLDVLSWILQAGTDILPAEEYAGCVFFFETSEEMPSADTVYWTLRSMGERGLLRQFPAVLVGRAKSWDFAQPRTPEQKRQYAADQQAAVDRAMREYAPDAVLVFDVDIGHTDPQLTMPFGGLVRVDSIERRIAVRY
ncbi:MAG TPA: S66 peptidase family protein [Micromonosporaceae bacterium]|jgi:muramoyltetrapeptide carboxypeptidase LdcA involved in peptidoglycan recycling